MSKNKNYTNYSKPRNEQVEEVTPEVVTETVVEEVAETPVEQPVKPTTLKGVVTCNSKLNVRKSPNPTAEVVKVINNGTKVTIEEDESTATFYKVRGLGFEGYCMKKFITVK